MQGEKNVGEKLTMMLVRYEHVDELKWQQELL